MSLKGAVHQNNKNPSIYLDSYNAIFLHEHSDMIVIEVSLSQQNLKTLLFSSSKLLVSLLQVYIMRLLSDNHFLASAASTESPVTVIFAVLLSLLVFSTVQQCYQYIHRMLMLLESSSNIGYH